MSEQIKKDGESENIINPSEKEEATNADTLDSADTKEEQKESTSDSIVDIIESEKDEDAQIEKNTIYDINITGINYLIKYTLDKGYDFFILEPFDDKVKVSFRKDKIEKEAKYIKYPVYTQILLKAKSITKLQVEETEASQEGEAVVNLGNINLKVVSKTSPSNSGEKLFFKIEKVEQNTVKKEKKKASLGTIFGFLGTIFLIALILTGSFIAFVVFNAQSVDDVRFFYSLGINLNDINSFIETSVGIIFSILLFIEVIFLIIFLFKFFLTKKQYKKQKIVKAIASFILLVITFSTLSAWMFLDKKIKQLPNWLELSYGDVKMYDNSKLLSKYFDENSSLMLDNTNLIGPITIKYDLNNFINKETRNGFETVKIIWDFDGEIIETIDPTIIKTFNKKGTYNISINVIEKDIHGKQIEKSIEDVKSIELSSIVDINEEILKDGGKIVSFNATDLKDLGKIDWYFIDKNETDQNLESVYNGYIFNPGKVIFDETIVGMQIKRNGKDNEVLDKVFIVNNSVDNDISGKIIYEQDPIDDLKYTIKVEKPNTNFGDGFIEQFIWTIGDKVITKKSNPNDLEESSKITHDFINFGKNDIQVELIDSNGNTKILNTTVDIPKQLKFKNTLDVYNNGKLVDNIRYEEKTREYFINNLGTPTSIQLDASNVESDNFLYQVSKVEWDTSGDGKIDKTGEKINFDINISGNYTIGVKYTFVNRKIPDDIVYMKESVYIESEKKDAILDLRMIYNSDYAPVTVAFDASKSQIKGKNISKFIFDYGDGTPSEERDAINPGHKYAKAGDYNIVLTAITTDGGKYSITKKLVLKPTPQEAKIKVSLKKVNIYQGIDFSSGDSSGQISHYFWDFGDGEISTQANPTHHYKDPGVYTVNLTIDFKNNNSLKDSVEIVVTE